MKEINSIYPSPYHAFNGVTMTETAFFKFEEDFAADNVRCIPMIVRFKLDACGIKLKLSEWSKMTIDERIGLSVMECITGKEVREYRGYLQQLIAGHTGTAATDLPVDACHAGRKAERI
jgi:hypothetical protein